MGCSIGRRVAIVGLGLVLAACSGSKSETGSGGANGTAGASFGGGSAGGASGACTPGATRCDGLNVKQCDDSGAKETITSTCSSSQTCSNGKCEAGACVPKTSTCKDGAVWKCSESGVSSLAEQCAAGLFCRVDGNDASCSAQACTPAEAVCDGNVATFCRADGAGVVPGGMDCRKSMQACDGGKCRPVVCTNGEKSCQHGDVYLCSHNGTDTSLLAACSTDEVCDADMGSCRKKLCEPGKASCDGTRTVTCNAFGSAWLPTATDCATDGKICVNGGCKKQICAQNRSFCKDGDVYSCDSSGTSATLSQSCNPSTEHCATYSGGSFGYCKANDCHAGDTLCDDNVIKVCNADGSLPATGTACDDTQFCESGQCKPRPCVLGSYFCKGSDVYYCDFNSPFVFLSQTCDADSSCQPLGTSGAVCAPLTCKPSSTACVGDKIGTCAANGQGLSSVTTDCTATSNVCTSDLKCAKSATDLIGEAENAEVIAASTLVGDAIDVDSTRHLIELQTQLVLSGPRELRWIVYEQSGQTFAAKVDKVVSAVAGSGLVSSGPFDCKLIAGKRYLLGVVISGGDGIDYIDAMPFVRDVSFGTVAGRFVTSYPSTFDVGSVDTSYVSRMKVVTEAP